MSAGEASPGLAPRTASLAVLVDGLRWGLAVFLILQLFASQVVPTLFDVSVSLLEARRLGVCGSACDLVHVALLGWGVFSAVTVAQIELLRRLGPFPYSVPQVLAMALLPGYNLYGTVELFTAQGEALERLGGGRHLGITLRALAALANGLTVAVDLQALRLYAPLIWSTARRDPWAPFTPSYVGARDLIYLGVSLLLVRILVLALLQLGQRKALEAVRVQRGIEPLPPTPRAAPAPVGLPGVRTALGVAGLTLLLAATTLLTARPERGPEAEEAGLAWEPRGPIAAPVPIAAPPPAFVPYVAPPEDPNALPAGHLLGGRPLDWWRERLDSLRRRTDEEGRRLYAATRERAQANGLSVREEGATARVAALPETIAAARAGVE